MCGIAGIFHYSNEAPVDGDLVRRMTATLVHRGPDDEGYHLAPEVGLGHRRLSIIDLAGGRQPIFNEDGTVAVIFNGEIYNYRDLSDHLRGCGHVLRTRTDTEAIVHLYEEYGESCLLMLRGMFAFALWDGRKKKLMLARDRIGKKPLYYAEKDGRLIFGSEIKALLEVQELRRDIDATALADYLSYQYIPSPKTIYQGIRKLEPGHYLTAGPGGIRKKAYWDPDFRDPVEQDEHLWSQQLLDSLVRSVGCRLESEVPLGAFLSGGVDSSAVVALMSRFLEKPPLTMTAGFDEQEFDESDDARWFAEQCSTEHHEVRVRPDPGEVLERLAWHFDEPFADASAVPMYYISKTAREFVKVALSGDGGDENFAGYRRYLFDWRENRIRSLASPSIRSRVFGALSDIYPKAEWLPQPLRASATLRNLALDPAAAYYRSVYGAMVEHRDALLGGDVRRNLKDYDPFEIFLDHFNRAGTKDPLARVQYVDFKTYLPDDILTKVDRASMAVSLEVRSPLLDHQFVSLAARIPSRFKIRGGEGKYIFKRALSGILPRQVLNRRKRGFVTPIAQWLREDLRGTANEILFGPCSGDGLIDRNGLARIWSMHQSGRRDLSRPLWAALMFRMWQRNFG
ncbi:MAG: asparagine synthase (glutamine-hydrolyzing) [Blastocatellales bacterium]